MIIPENIENLAELVKGPEKTVFFFTAGWCGDCNFIKPKMPEIETENPEFRFVEVDRDCLLYTFSEPTRLDVIAYAVFCLKKKKGGGGGGGG
ncbi:MAG: thioredoxin family protein, partial [Lactococcus lactis]|nr:thioredoxin family protein [Lactococcus lactis]